MVTTTWFSVTGGVKVGLPAFHFWHQDSVSSDWFGQFTASQPVHSLTMSIMNGFARLRFEFIIHNQRHTLAFESWVVTINFGSSTQWFTTRWSMFGLIQKFHKISTLPTSHHKYNEWLEMVENGVRALWWLPQRDFQSRRGSKLSCLYSTFHSKIEWVWTDLGNSQHLNPSILSP